MDESAHLNVPQRNQRVHLVRAEENKTIRRAPQRLNWLQGWGQPQDTRNRIVGVDRAIVAGSSDTGSTSVTNDGYTSEVSGSAWDGSQNRYPIVRALNNPVIRVFSGMKRPMIWAKGARRSGIYVVRIDGWGGKSAS